MPVNGYLEKTGDNYPITRLPQSRWFLAAAERFMAKLHDNEATLSRNRHASATGGPQGNRREGGGNSRRETAVDECRKEITDRIARYQAD